MRNKVLIRLNDKEMEQLRVLARAFSTEEKEAIKTCISHAFNVYVHSLKEAAKKGVPNAEGSVQESVPTPVG